MKPFATALKDHPWIAVVALLVLAAALSVLAWMLWPVVRAPGWAAHDPGKGPVSLAGVLPRGAEPPLRGPFGAAVLSGHVYVSEADGSSIRVLDLDGVTIQTLALPAERGAPTAYPSDLEVLGDGRLAVVDNASQRVRLFEVRPDGTISPTGSFRASTPTATPVQPTAVTALGGEQIAIADGADKTIKVYSRTGALLRTLGSQVEPRLTFVSGMALVDGVLVVSDTNAARVVFLDPKTGAMIDAFPDRFAQPRAIIAIRGRTFAVVDTFGRSVRFCTLDGATKLSIGSAESTLPPEARLGSPRAAAWDAAARRLYVTDTGSGRIVVYNVSSGSE
ncbi:MAG: hypothetical protein Q7W30_01315 [Coriobacteriia bacterium]|nr:hypothetical protein [Coriobacteriia bacterium]